MSHSSKWLFLLFISSFRIARTFCFSNHGHAMYMCSPTELQKITYSAEIWW